MSIGNLKDSGNQGNNFPFQLKVLQGLSKAIEITKCENLFSRVLNTGAYNSIPDLINDDLANYPDSYLVSQSITYDTVNELYVVILIYSTL